MTCPDCDGLGYIGDEDTPSSCMNRWHKLARNESIERVSRVTKERDEFNHPMTNNQSTAIQSEGVEHPHYILGKVAFDMGFERDDYEDGMMPEGEVDIIAKAAWQQGWDDAKATHPQSTQEGN